jgi:hypothetical protein
MRIVSSVATLAFAGMTLVGLAGAAVAGPAPTRAGTSSAAMLASDKDGICDSGPQVGELCVYDRDGFSVADFRTADANHGDDVFRPSGRVVLGNAAVMENRDYQRFARVFSGTNFTGANVVAPPSSGILNYPPPAGGTGSNDWL